MLVLKTFADSRTVFVPLQTPRNSSVAPSLPCPWVYALCADLRMPSNRASTAQRSVYHLCHLHDLYRLFCLCLRALRGLRSTSSLPGPVTVSWPLLVPSLSSEHPVEAGGMSCGQPLTASGWHGASASWAPGPTAWRRRSPLEALDSLATQAAEGCCQCMIAPLALAWMVPHIGFLLRLMTLGTVRESSSDPPQSVCPGRGSSCLTDEATLWEELRDLLCSGRRALRRVFEENNVYQV
jgi:hypothetical protein